MSSYLCIKNSKNETKSYELKASANAPYLKVNTTGYLQLTSETSTKWGRRVKGSNNKTYSVVESYTTTINTSSTYSVNTNSTYSVNTNSTYSVNTNSTYNTIEKYNTIKTVSTENTVSFANDNIADGPITPLMEISYKRIISNTFMAQSLKITYSRMISINSDIDILIYNSQNGYTSKTSSYSKSASLYNLSSNITANKLIPRQPLYSVKGYPPFDFISTNLSINDDFINYTNTKITYVGFTQQSPRYFTSDYTYDNRTYKAGAELMITPKYFIPSGSSSSILLAFYFLTHFSMTYSTTTTYIHDITATSYYTIPQTSYYTIPQTSYYTIPKTSYYTIPQTSYYTTETTSQ